MLGSTSVKKRLFSSPRYIQLLENENLLIADSMNNRILEVDQNQNVIWSFEKCYHSSVLDTLYWPRWAQPLKAGRTLIADGRNGRIILVDEYGRLLRELRQYRYRGNNYNLGDPHFVKQLNNGNWLIVDSLYHSVIEVNEQDEAVWLYGLIGGMPLNDPHCAARNDYEETLIVDSANHRLLIVSQDLEVLWECSFLLYEGQLVHLSWPRYADFLPNGNIFLIDGKLGVGFELKRNGQVTKIHRSMDMNVTFAMRKTRCIHMIGNEIVFISDNENSRILKVRYT